MANTQPALILRPLLAQPPVPMTIYKDSNLHAQCISHLPPPQNGDNSVAIRECKKNHNGQKILLIGCNISNRGVPNEYIQGMYGSVMVTGGYRKLDGTGYKLMPVAQNELNQFIAWMNCSLH